MESFDIEVLSVSAGSSIKSIKELGIYECPASGRGYESRGKRKPLYIAFRAKGGVVDTLYKVADLRKMPIEGAEFEKMKQQHIEPELTAKIDQLKQMVHLDYDDSDKWVFVLDLEKSIKLPHEVVYENNNAFVDTRHTVADFLGEPDASGKVVFHTVKNKMNDDDDDSDADGLNNVITYEASSKVESDWIDKNSKSHEFADGKGTIVLKDGVTEIGNGAFQECGITSIILPDSVERIGRVAFYECENLKDVTLGNSVTEIGEMAFLFCWELIYINIPDSLMEIGYSAFFKTNVCDEAFAQIEDISEDAFTDPDEFPPEDSDEDDENEDYDEDDDGSEK